MDRITQIAAVGMGATTGTAIVQNEKRLALLDIDIFMGCLSFDVPVGNVIVLLGFCFSSYAFYRAREHSKRQKRRKNDSARDPQSVKARGDHEI